MKPVTQDQFGDRGNCFAAALASILEVPLETVPHFRVTDPDDMDGAATRWLLPQGVRFLRMYFQSQEDLNQVHFGFSMYCMVSGKSARTRPDGQHRWHAVVGRTLPWGVELLHDPHPDRTFFIPEGERFVTLIVFPPTHPLYRDHVGLEPVGAP